MQNRKVRAESVVNEFELLCNFAKLRFNETALDKALLELHTQPSTQGKLRIREGAPSTHLLLNVCFLHAALNVSDKLKQRAYSDFLIETINQGTRVDSRQVFDTIEEVAAHLTEPASLHN